MRAMHPQSADASIQNAITATNPVPARLADHVFRPLSETLPPITSAEKRELTTCDAHVRTASAAMHKAGIEIAYYGWRIKKSQRWYELGCMDERGYCLSRGISYSVWQKCMPVGRVLEALPFEELAKIGIEKGIYLSGVNPDLWHDYDWLGDARRMSKVKLRELINLRHDTLKGGDRSAAIQHAEKRAITRTKLREIVKEHGLESTDDAIALALEGVGGSVPAQLLAAAKHANKLLTLARKALRNPSTHMPRSKETDRLIVKAKERLMGAIAVATAVRTQPQSHETSAQTVHAA